MVVKSVAINAYQNAMDTRRSSLQKTVNERLKKPQEPVEDFSDTLKTSMDKINELQANKKQAIEEFATGKSQNVHELMITMQKASLSMQLTSAVRSKVMQSYKEIMQMSF